MAELLIKVDDGAGYLDGDCLCAFNNRRIDCVHAQRLCHIDGAGFTASGLRPTGSVAQDYLNATRQYRFERVSTYTIERVTIATGVRQVLTGPEFDVSINGGPTIHVTHNDLRHHRQFAKLPSSAVAVLVAAVRTGLQAVQMGESGLSVAGVETPYTATPTNGEAIHVPEFVDRRKKHERHALFGVPGFELWYGGRTDHSPTAMSVAWNAIETKTPRRRSEPEFALWPLGRLDARHHLPIRTDDFDDAEAADLVESIQGDEQDDGDGHVFVPVIHKRKSHLRWDTDAILAALGVTAAQVRDKSRAVGRDRDIPWAMLNIQTRTKV